MYCVFCVCKSVCLYVYECMYDYHIAVAYLASAPFDSFFLMCFVLILKRHIRCSSCVARCCCAFKERLIAVSEFRTVAGPRSIFEELFAEEAPIKESMSH